MLDMYCRKCGAKVSEKDEFCHECGEPQDAEIKPVEMEVEKIYCPLPGLWHQNYRW